MSHAQLIHNHLAEGRSITGLEALRLFGCFRLPARIWDLKRQGFPVKSRRIQVGEKKVSEYYLEK